MRTTLVGCLLLTAKASLAAQPAVEMDSLLSSILQTKLKERKPARRQHECSLRFQGTRAGNSVTSDNTYNWQQQKYVLVVILGQDECFGSAL
jgi:hypothetical protein